MNHEMTDIFFIIVAVSINALINEGTLLDQTLRNALKVLMTDRLKSIEMTMLQPSLMTLYKNLKKKMKYDMLIADSIVIIVISFLYREIHFCILTDEFNTYK